MRSLSTFARILVSLGIASCGRFASGPHEPAWAEYLPENIPLSGELRVHPDQREEPAVELRLPVANPGTTLGWGAMHLWARPALDEVGVSAIIDAPASTARWTDCREARFEQADGKATSVPATYVGAPLVGDTSVYDAVQLRIGIDVLRAMSAEEGGRWTVCGDTFELSDAQLRNLRSFVDWFDVIAAPSPHGELPYFRDVGPRPEMPLEVMPGPPLDA